MISVFPRSRWESAQPTDLSDELERGRIVLFPECPIPLPDASDLDFLREELPRHLKHKNPSYHTESDRIMGVRGREIQERARRVLSVHYAHVRAFLERVLPAFARNWKTATSSFRPVQEKGREIRRHASSELLHIDSGAYGATQGDRILRFFVNVHPTEERVWISKGAFPELFRKYGEAAGIAGPHRLEKGVWNSVYSGLLGLASAVAPVARLADTSPYDRLMHRFHNWMKDTPEFQSDPEGRQEIRFRPFSAWMVLTDMLSHACIYGQHAFIDTFLVPLANCRLPELSPYRILSGAAPRETAST